MDAQDGAGGKGPVFFRRRDLLVAGALLLAAGIWLAVTLLTQSTGAVATASFVRGSDRPPVVIDLTRDGLTHLDADLPVTLEVKDGAVRFIDSVCPDHLCEGYGWLRAEGEWAACLPAGVLVTVTEGG